MLVLRTAMQYLVLRNGSLMNTVMTIRHEQRAIAIATKVRSNFYGIVTTFLLD